MTCRHPTRPVSARNGFTLVEVTIALAIIAATCIPLIAMLPAGMQTMHKGRDAIIETEIIRLLSNEMSMSSWSKTNNLEDFEDEDRYFDLAGVPLEDSDKAIFTARINVGDDTALPGSSRSNRFLRRVTIKVTSDPEVVDDRFTNRRHYRSLSVLMAKTDK